MQEFMQRSNPLLFEFLLDKVGGRPECLLWVRAQALAQTLPRLPVNLFGQRSGQVNGLAHMGPIGRHVRIVEDPAGTARNHRHHLDGGNFCKN